MWHLVSDTKYPSFSHIQIKNLHFKACVEALTVCSTRTVHVKQVLIYLAVHLQSHVYHLLIKSVYPL